MKREGNGASDMQGSEDDTLDSPTDNPNGLCHETKNDDVWQDIENGMVAVSSIPKSLRARISTRVVVERRDSEEDSFTKKNVSETRLVNLIRLLLFVVLLSVTVLVSVAVYYFTMKDEQQRFEDHVGVYSEKIIDSFHHAISKRLDAMNAMATTITSYALATNQTFPFVTLPDFELHGAVLRVQAETHAMHYCPLIPNDDVRKAWETYALDHRNQIDIAFESETRHRQRQDDFYGISRNRHLQDNTDTTTSTMQLNETILGDGTGYHPKIWSNGATIPRGDEPYSGGPYFPAWQRRYE